MRKKFRNTFGVILVIILVGLILPQHMQMPVVNATKTDYEQNSFWFYPWGKSLTHKGVDIFAKRGTTIKAATSGLVLYSGQIEMGGNVVLILGPKWRLFYYAHLDSILTKTLTFVTKNSVIGTVGSSGNAVGKPPHLHFAIKTLIPYPWRIDKSVQGWKKNVLSQSCECAVANFIV